MSRSNTVHTRFVAATEPEADARPDGAAFEALLHVGGVPLAPRSDLCLDARDVDLDEGIVFRPRSRV